MILPHCSTDRAVTYRYLFLISILLSQFTLAGVLHKPWPCLVPWLCMARLKK